MGRVLKKLRKISTHGKATKIFIQIFSRNKNCVLKISNNGSKIEDEIVQLLFKETFQKENHNSVGLLISRKLLYQLNGTIDLVTNEEGNVTFEIKVPQCNENT
ncbi:MAG: ATP-binding protein [Candidatus Heimdallarchaeum endolithica]|uniref:ATP-binding protein n=1 Tax=Candidatus Heimdallarchaeum endolithica TaxID=2876572 RepID=A0A9Y1BS38_9ARCH|nr:MAG: ATP-binding protein [Candidatus Heimdallarchaeum endolithica]